MPSSNIRAQRDRLDVPGGGIAPERVTGPFSFEIATVLPEVAQQVAAQLEIVGRIGEDHVHRAGRQAVHHGDAIADQDAVLMQGNHGR